MVDGIQVRYERSINNLGIMMDSALSWRDHVGHISNRVYKILYQLRRDSHIFPTNIRIHLIKTLILPHFDYGCLVYNDLSGELNLKLERVLNACVRFIFDVPIFEHITPFYHRLGWMRLETRRSYILGTFLYNLFKNKSPGYLHDLFKFRCEMGVRALRSSAERIVIPNHRTAAYGGSFMIASARLWNSLPSEIRSMKSLGRFKRLLFDHLKCNS